jgi:hypothetical protein
MLDNRVIRKVRKTQHHQNHPEFWSYTGWDYYYYFFKKKTCKKVH